MRVSIARKHDKKLIAANLVYLIEETRRQAESEKDRLAQEAFECLISKKEVRFLMLKDSPGYRIPPKIRGSAGSRKLTREDGSQLEQSLLEFMYDDDLNSLEKGVAWYLDEQKKLLWWYRNMARSDYAIQGWRKNRIYPDVIVSEADPKDSSD